MVVGLGEPGEPGGGGETNHDLISRERRRVFDMFITAIAVNKKQTLSFRI